MMWKMGMKIKSRDYFSSLVKGNIRVQNIVLYFYIIPLLHLLWWESVVKNWGVGCKKKLGTSNHFPLPFGLFSYFENEGKCLTDVETTFNV